MKNFNQLLRFVVITVLFTAGMIACSPDDFFLTLLTAFVEQLFIASWTIEYYKRVNSPTPSPYEWGQHQGQVQARTLILFLLGEVSQTSPRPGIFLSIILILQFFALMMTTAIAGLPKNVPIFFLHVVGATILARLIGKELYSMWYPKVDE